MNRLQEIRKIHKRCSRHKEHGQEFLICGDCGASWSLNPAQDRDGRRYTDCEEIDSGDEFCFSKLRRRKK